MPEYRLYRFQQGRIRKAADVIDVGDDAEAIALAERAWDGDVIELWLGARLIRRLEPGDPPPKPGA